MDPQRNRRVARFTTLGARRARFAWILALALPFAQLTVAAHATVHSPVDGAPLCAVCAAGSLTPLPATGASDSCGTALCVDLGEALVPRLRVCAVATVQARAPPRISSRV